LSKNVLTEKAQMRRVFFEELELVCVCYWGDYCKTINLVSFLMRFTPSETNKGIQTEKNV